MSDRVYFERATGGKRLVCGIVIENIQKQLTAAGCDTKGLDGVFGRDTENAINQFQAAKGLAKTGSVTQATWAALFPGVPCAMLERALQLTADFEGHGFGKAVGNFDKAGLTWGIIGFTLSNGEVQRLLLAIDAKNPGLLDAAFGGKAPELRAMLAADRARQMQWAEDISLGTSRYKILPEWADGFLALGDMPQARAEQMLRVGDYWKRAERDFADLGLATERGLALCFDIAVQNGGVSKAEKDDIAWELSRRPGLAERDRLAVIGNVVADNGSPTWREVVRGRKLAIATGTGTVNGAGYDLRCWGLEDVNI